jgi:16S rRNA A1518/A1519 N6-dimethyltransferase RsmA/KsgA/DIM1 with predicted DNA glycosylase/AP lyase activity
MADKLPFPNVQTDITDLQRRVDEQAKHFHTVRQAFQARIETLEAELKALKALVERQARHETGAPRG